MVQSAKGRELDITSKIIETVHAHAPHLSRQRVAAALID